MSEALGGTDGVVVRTSRLRVRPWRHEEAPRLLDILSRPEVVRWLDDGPPVLMQDLDEAHASIDRYAARNAQRPPLGFWAVEVVETAQVAGSVLLLTLPNAEHDEVEIGWHLHPDSWGHGYATEAASGLLSHAWAHGITEVWACTTPDNGPSQAVCRRLGMSDEGVATRWYEEPSQFFLARPPRPGPPGTHDRP